MQLVLADILKDKLFMTNFFRNNAALVYNSFSVLNSCLTSLNVEIVGPAVGTTFVFADHSLMHGSVIRIQPQS